MPRGKTTRRAVGADTVRQQAQAVHRKSGLAGRAELSAFFLEDLMLPGATVPETAVASPVRRAVPDHGTRLDDSRPSGLLFVD